MPKAKSQSQGFEESLAALESIVVQLEAGDLPLERALEIFEDGVGLARRCQTQLAEAERKVEMLLREHGELKVVPFDAQKIQADNTTQAPRIRRVSDPEKPAADNHTFTEELMDDPDEITKDNFDDDDVPF